MKRVYTKALFVVLATYSFLLAPAYATDTSSTPEPTTGSKARALTIVVDIPFVASMAKDLLSENDSVISLIKPGDSPHDYLLRPRTVKLLQNADLVVSVTHDLSPNITRALKNIASGTTTLELASAPGIKLLPSRESGQHKDHGHETGSTDPHLWLSPKNLPLMIQALTTALSEIDPTRSKNFIEASAESIRRIQHFVQQQEKRWHDNSNNSFISLHDATYYFEDHFKLISKGSLFGISHVNPSVQQLKAVRATLKKDNISCVITDTNTQPRWVNTLTENTRVNVVSVDVLGLLPNGVHYLTTMQQLADSFADCLGVQALAH